MIFKVKNLLQLLVLFSSIIISHAVEITEEELDSFEYGDSPFRLAVVGDTGAVSAAREVLKLASYDALLHLGDFDYDKKPDAFFDKVLPSDRHYAFMGVLGNHDALSENSSEGFRRFRDNVYREMKDGKIDCTFSDSKYMWSCHFHNMRIIGLSPNVKGTDDRSKQLRFLKEHLGEATEDWKVCAWHYYDKYYHTGKYPKDGNLVSGDGESFYDYCKEHGAIIFSAHDHVYARTHVMSKFSSKHIDEYDNKEYVNTEGDIVQIRKGATFNILNGAGGYEMYVESGEHKHYDHWQKKYALGDNKENEHRFGGLFCTFNVGGNNKKATCEFLRIRSSNKLFDNFTIYQNENPESVSYIDIDDSFMNEKKKAYMMDKGIIDPSTDLDSTSPLESINKGEGGNNSKSKSSKTGIIIGASACAVVALVAGGLIVLKIKKNKDSIDEPQLVMRSSKDDFNYRNQVSANENKSVVDDDFVALPMPSYNNDYLIKNSHFKCI